MNHAPPAACQQNTHISRFQRIARRAFAEWLASKLEDPVVIPTEEERAESLRKSREHHLLMLQRDDDGWNDLWVLLQKARDKDYEFDPNDKTKDTDGDGVSDYEEMLVNRNASFVEPVYTEEELIEQVREGRRQAIEAEKNAVVRAFKRREELAHLIIPPLTTEDGVAATTQAVEAEKRQKLAVLAEQNLAMDAVRKLRADAFAARNNIDKHFVGADGQVSSLVDVVDGIPKFRTTNNSVSADTISTDEVRSGGSLGLSLDGSGITFGIWDGGDIYTAHSEFTTGGQRVTDKDGTSPIGIHFHPTHVAGTMMAKGLDGTAMGMAPSALLHAYDWINDLSEMTTAANIDNLRLSNHSYGLAQGWGSVTIGGVAYLAWHGDTTVSNTEDYLFGFYSENSREMDILAYNAPDYLTVWSATNEREPDTTANGPHEDLQPLGHYALNGETNEWVPTFDVTRPVDGGETGFDLLSHEGVSKNVMTVTAVEDIVGGWTSASGVTPAIFSSFGPPDDGR